MAEHTCGLTLFMAYRFIYIEPRSPVAVAEEFNLTSERTSALLRKLERTGFIYRKRNPARKNGIVYCANVVNPGVPCFFTADPGTMLPS